MLEKIIAFSLRNKLIILLFTLLIVGFGLFSITQISIGAVPDVTNNQVQVITTSRNLSTQDIEQFITYPVEIEMANLPGVNEIRSISKFGLSVVTIVFAYCRENQNRFRKNPSRFWNSRDGAYYNRFGRNLPIHIGSKTSM
jgi:Cu/Ag efflux pump CusA